jgi:hypothetical protein
MKRILLLGAVVALPLAFTGCGTYVGVEPGYGDPGYYAYGGPGYYDGVVGDVGVYGYDRGGYHSHYHHYDGSSQHTDVASHNVSHGSHVASVSHASGGHVGGGGSVSHASASVGGGGGGHSSGGGGHH